MPRMPGTSASLARILNTQKPITKNFAGLHNHFNYASEEAEAEAEAEAVAAKAAEGN